MKTTKSHVPTPLDRLLAEKLQLRQQCLLQEQQLNKEWEYIRQHARPLLISGIVSFFSSHTVTDKENNEQSNTEGQSYVPDYLSIAKETWPLIWNMAKPLLINWGISKMKEWVEKIIKK